MKYLLALLAGLVTGVILFALLLYFNPLAAPAKLSPLALSETSQRVLNYSAVPADMVALTSSDEQAAGRRPAEIQTLWEPAIEDTRVFVSLLNGSRGQPAALGVKFTTRAEEPGLLVSRVPVNSVWHLWWLGEGSLFVAQNENRWSLLRQVIAPARLGAANVWRGTWFGIMTSGPGALGTGRVAGGSGVMQGLDGEAVESINARAYSATEGPVSMDGSLVIALPR
ncbi:MAG: hypothetical protein U5K76_09760 [Woeseiaceae bacterium]|nr:hypothetical protein [Woeseiaceae bacterium]